MRHRVYGKHLSRDKNQRNALFKGLVRSLILYGSITTTEAKAKAIKGLVDRLIVKGKEGSNQAKTFVQSVLPDAKISKKLLEEVVPSYKSRTSGFTGLVRLGRRVGDGAVLVKMSLMEGEEKLKTENSKLKTATQKSKVKVQKQKKGEATDH